MRFSHKIINGKCVYCGAIDGSARQLQLESSALELREPVKIDLLKDEFDLHCPRARFYVSSCYILSVSAPIFALSGFGAFLISLVCGGGISYLFLNPEEDEKWLGMKEVRDEYEKLRNILASEKKLYYLKQVDAALKPLFQSRDKARKALSVVIDDPPGELEVKIRALRQDIERISDPDLKKMHVARLRDLEESLERVLKIVVFLERFVIQKQNVAASIKLLRTKLLQALTSGEEREVTACLQDLDQIHKVYELVDSEVKLLEK